MKLFHLFIVLLLAGCSEGASDEVQLRLTSDERRQIDTTVANAVKELRPEYDSICAADFEEMAARATDSIVQRRLEEEARLRARIPLQIPAQ